MSQEISAQAETKLSNGQSKEDGEQRHVHKCDQISYSKTPFIRVNWDDDSSGYAENQDN